MSVVSGVASRTGASGNPKNGMLKIKLDDFAASFTRSLAQGLIRSKKYEHYEREGRMVAILAVLVREVWAREGLGV